MDSDLSTHVGIAPSSNGEAYVIRADGFSTTVSMDFGVEPDAVMTLNGDTAGELIGEIESTSSSPMDSLDGISTTTDASSLLMFDGSTEVWTLPSSDSTDLYSSTELFGDVNIAGNLKINGEDLIPYVERMIKKNYEINQMLQPKKENDMNMIHFYDKIGAGDLSFSAWVLIILLVIVVSRASRSSSWKTVLTPVKWLFRGIGAVAKSAWNAIRRDAEEAKKAWDEIK